MGLPDDWSEERKQRWEEARQSLLDREANARAAWEAKPHAEVKAAFHKASIQAMNAETAYSSALHEQRCQLEDFLQKYLGYDWAVLVRPAKDRDRDLDIDKWLPGGSCPLVVTISTPLTEWCPERKEFARGTATSEACYVRYLGDGDGVWMLADTEENRTLCAREFILELAQKALEAVPPGHVFPSSRSSYVRLP